MRGIGNVVYEATFDAIGSSGTTGPRGRESLLGEKLHAVRLIKFGNRSRVVSKLPCSITIVC